VARIRTVKPDFWTDAAVGECSVSARLLLIASLNFADDYGGLDRSSKQLKAQAFPYDNIDCEPLVLELLRNGLFVEYEVDGRKYLHIKGFRKHQKVENPAKPRIPLYESTPTPTQTITEASPNPPRVVAVSSLEGKGREGKTKSAPAVPAWFSEFRLAYPPRAGSQRWRDAERAANSRLAEGHVARELIDGAIRYATYCRALGKLKTEFVLQAATFLGPNKQFLEPWDTPETPASRNAELRTQADLRAFAELKSRAERIGYRQPLEGEDLIGYRTLVERAESNTPRRVTQ
jgi:hypothetical protein